MHTLLTIAMRWSAVVCVLALGCTGADKTHTLKEFLPRQLSGQVAGQEWSYLHAYVDPTISTPEENDYVIVLLPHKPAQPCPVDEAPKADARVVMVTAPLKVTTKPLTLKRGGARTLQFHTVKNAAPFVVSALSGKLKITAVTASEVKGQVYAAQGARNFVNGSFKAVVCDRSEMQKEDLWDQ